MVDNLRHMKGEEGREQPPIFFKLMSHLCTMRFIKPSMLISFFKKKNADELIKVKTVRKLDFQAEKNNFYSLKGQRCK